MRSCSCKALPSLPRFNSVLQIRAFELSRYFAGGPVDKLRNQYLPEFMKMAGVKDLSCNGFRLVVDVPEFNPVLFDENERPAEIRLYSGAYTPNLAPQDWTTPKPVSWDPTAHTPFFEICAQAARENIAQTPSGGRLFLSPAAPEAFGLSDLDPKADSHFVLFSTGPFATIMDRDFSYKALTELFKLADHILTELGLQDQKTRYCINSGFGYQSIARLHMHVMSFAHYMPKILPQGYGFEVLKDGSVRAPEGSEKHLQVLDAIEKRGDKAEIFNLLRGLPL